MSWLTNYKLRVTIGGIIVLTIGLIVYFATGKTIILIVPFIGAVFLVIGIAWYVRAGNRKQPSDTKPVQS